VDALHRIHAALGLHGLVVDTQPISARPAVSASSGLLGRLDMREWLGIVQAVDALVERAIADELYAIEGERHFVVTDTFDNGPGLVETVSGWRGTRISQALARRVEAARPPVLLRQEVRLRLLRRLG
jgi:hypothetical protein